jgi:hypothetical protein
MTTTVTPSTVRDAINKGNLNTLPDAFKAGKLGDTFSKIKAVVTGLSATASPDITSAAVKAAAVITGISLATGENLPPIGQVVSLRVTAGSAGAGPRTMTDNDGTATGPDAYAAGLPGVAKLADDGKTFTLETTCTGFVLVYYPAPTNMDANLAMGAP